MWKSLADKDYRHAYAAAHVGDYLAMQIHSLRVSRGWTQKHLAEESDVTQPQISNYESSCEGVTLTSLHKLAEAFDVALIVKFVPFSRLVKETLGSRADRAVPSYDDDSKVAISFPPVSVSIQPSPRRNGRSSADDNAYVRQLETTGSTFAIANISR